MNKKNNKLALNKQIVANLNGQEMNGVKGGVDATVGVICTAGFAILTGYMANVIYSEANPIKGPCLDSVLCGVTKGCTDKCTENCFTRYDNCTVGISCAKCG